MRAYTILLLTLFTFPGIAFAAEHYSIVINGHSRHLNKSIYTEKLNENNLGTGIEYRLPESRFFTAGTYVDSFNKAQLYAGFGKWQNFFNQAGFNASYGGTLLVMTHSIAFNGKPFLAPIPAVSFGFKAYHLNIAYTPKIDETQPALLFFQSKIDIN